jgi:hypothetical protein
MNTITIDKSEIFTNVLSLDSVFSFIKEKRDERALRKAWAERNLDQGEAMVTTLELDAILFQQSIFIEHNKDIMEKLVRIGFRPLSGFPDESLFENFSSIMYNKKFNVSFSIYQPKHKKAISTAYEIVKKANIDDIAGLSIFLSAIEVLIED